MGGMLFFFLGKRVKKILSKILLNILKHLWNKNLRTSPAGSDQKSIFCFWSNTFLCSLLLCHGFIHFNHFTSYLVFFVLNEKALKFCIVAVPAFKPKRQFFQVFIPKMSSQIPQIVRDKEQQLKLAVKYFLRGKSRVKIYSHKILPHMSPNENSDQNMSDVLFFLKKIFLNVWLLLFGF